MEYPIKVMIGQFSFVRKSFEKWEYPMIGVLIPEYKKSDIAKDTINFVAPSRILGVLNVRHIA